MDELRALLAITRARLGPLLIVGVMPVFVGIAATLIVVTAAIFSFGLVSVFGAILVGVPTLLCCVLLLIAMATGIAVAASGDPARARNDSGLGAGLRASILRAHRLIAAAIVIGALPLVVFVAPVALILMHAGHAHGAAGQTKELVVLYAWPPLALLAFLVGARLLPLFPLIVVEELPVFTAVRRAWSLTGPCALRVSISALVFALGWYAVSSLVALVATSVPVLGSLVGVVVTPLLFALPIVFLYVVYARCARLAV